MMKNEFAPYDLALALKELGFDEDVCGYFGKGNKLFIVTPEYNDVIKLLKAPLYQQSFRWFREKYDIDGYPQRCGQGYAYQIYIKFGTNDNESIPQKGWCKSYEEAELSCLKKLIEIVNQN